jgi:hypothetical protein
VIDSADDLGLLVLTMNGILGPMGVPFDSVWDHFGDQNLGSGGVLPLLELGAWGAGGVVLCVGAWRLQKWSWV